MGPTNNGAERALRPAVLWRKGSFGCESDPGSRFAEMVTADLQQRLNEVVEHARVAHQAQLARPVQQVTGAETLEQRIELLQRDLQVQNARLSGMQRDIGTLAEVIRRLLDQA